MSMKLSTSIITTPYERVLQIIKEAKSFINMMSKNQSKLIRNLEWVIKVITSHSLYRYELKDNEMIDKYSKENPNFKQFVDFVYEYNEEVIEMNKKKNMINTQSRKISNDLLSIPSFKLKRNNLNSFKSNTPVRRNKMNSFSNNKLNNDNLIINSIKGKKSNPNYKNYNTINNKNQLLSSPSRKSTEILTVKTKKEKNYLFSSFYSQNSLKEKDTRPLSQNSKSQKPKFENSFNYIETCIQNVNFSPKKILEKDFNIFELKKIIGHTNILPLMGKTILETFGLVDNSIISINKLDTFLFSVTKEYFTTTLYHNSMHGADVTQTVCLYFLNSNAEEICQTNVLDLLSILIASLGHDIGHPGLNNNFQINALTDMALTYNDISCLENFHVSKLFKLINKDENNIFEKLNNSDFKTIRKRMISEILATDMANHGKVMSVIKSRIPDEILDGNKNNIKFELLSKNPKTQFEEQQSLLDFFIHSADLAHNTKLFKISIQWVELLSNEFWLQGDKEKNMNLPVSFLCDRIGCNIPNSQIGFIKGFILPTFEVLIMMFPTLNYTVENAKINIGEWQKLFEEKRITGWTPKKEKNEDNDNNDNDNDNNNFIDCDISDDDNIINDINVNNDININNTNDNNTNDNNDNFDDDETDNGISRNEINSTINSNNTNIKNSSNNNSIVNNSENKRHLHHNSENGGNLLFNDISSKIEKNLTFSIPKKKNTKSILKRTQNKLQYCQSNSNTNNNCHFISNSNNINNINNNNYNINININQNVSPFKLSDIKKSLTTKLINPNLDSMKKK